MTKNIMSTQLTIHNMIPSVNDRKSYSPNLRQMIGNDNCKIYTPPLRKEDVDIETVSFGDQYWIIVKTQELQKFITDNTQICVKILKIYSSTDNLNLLRTVILESKPCKQLENDGTQSYFHYGKYLYYFKRLYIEDESS